MSVRRASCLLVAPAWLSTVWLSTPARADAPGYSDSGIHGPPYSEIAEATAQLPVDFPGWATVHDYGTTAAGRVLRLVKIRNPAATAAIEGIQANHPAVLVSGSTHGDEYLHIEDRLARWFLENSARRSGLMGYLAGGGIIYVVPILNPDGYDARTRENSAGVDLNRDFDLIPVDERHFTQVETRELAAWLDRDLRDSDADLKLTVDYHCCDGSLLFPWAYTLDALPTGDQAAHETIARLMQRDINPNYEYGPTGLVLGYMPRGTSKDYYYARYGATAFTFEGTAGTEDQNFDKHTVWWNDILATLTPTAALVTK